jgi:hypothetical protein
MTLRIAAVAIAAAAIIDPAVAVTREDRVPVRLRLDDRDPAARRVAATVRQAVGDSIAIMATGEAAAIVTIGDASPGPLPDRPIPVSSVDLAGVPDISLGSVPSSVTVGRGQTVSIPLELEGRGVAGQTSVVVLEDQGVDVARVEHRWHADGRAALSLPYLPTAGGPRAVRVRALPGTGEARLENNHADVLVRSLPGQFQVAVVEGRPSWAAGMVRRALETDPSFRVSALVRVSRGINARTGEAPTVVTAERLTPFDVVLVGAPEEMRDADLRALREFATVRGGTVVLLPDRRPTGPYAPLVASGLALRSTGELVEQLVDQPVLLQPASILAAEMLSVPPHQAVDTLVSHGDRAVIATWREGDGQIIFSGALDAWRYRGDSRSRFTQFWRETVARAAAAAPPRIDLQVDPAVVRPHGTVRLTARLRRTEFPHDAVPAALPAVNASMVSPGSVRQMIRLWPGSEPGLFEAEVRPGASGLHLIRVMSSGGGEASTMIAEAEEAVFPRAAGLDLADVPALSGGVAVRADDLDPLLAHLKGLPKPARPAVVHPMRSPWWMVPFAGALCAEWAIRRRKGHR